MGSSADNASIVAVLVSCITAISSAITTNSTNPATLANIATSITAQSNNDGGMTNQEADFLKKIATAIQATSPTSSIRNTFYSA
jgi:hypothetical protein